MEMNNETKKFSFLKYIIGAVVVLVFAIVLAFNYSLKNTYIYAATYNEICDGFSFSVSGSSAESSTGSNLSVTATGTAAGTCSSASAKTSTITITNTFPQAGTLNFSYTLDLKNGTITLDGTNVTQAGNYSKKISSGEKITITVKSAAAGTSTIFNMTNILSQFDINANITFDVADEGGSYTVSYGDINDDEIVELKTETINAVNPITFTALPLAGYKIYCWEINGNEEYYLSSTFSQAFTENTTIKPVFCDENAAIFTTKAGGVYFKSLTEANNYAKSAREENGRIIIPVGDVTTIPAGNYEISNNVKLLIPRDSSNDYKTTPAIETFSTPSLYKKLVLNSGVVIDVSGEILVASTVSANGQLGGYNGTPCGNHGEIYMSTDSVINLNSGSILYCWGYISGLGNIEAKSGSTVYEFFQLKDWRGGSATFKTTLSIPTGISDTLKNNKVFPFSQYYVQNIEANLIINYGAKEILKCYANAASQTPSGDVNFIGNSSTYMFYLKSGKIIKHYDANLDQLVVDIYGDISISSITISMYLEIKTSDYILPLNNMNIIVHSGQISISQSAELLPGSRLEISKNSTLIVERGYDLIVYDKEDWKNYTGGTTFYPLSYTAANGTNNSNIRKWNNITSAEICVDGYMIVRGGFYCTNSDSKSTGANVHSNNTLFNKNSDFTNGSILFENDAGTMNTVYQVTQSGTTLTLASITIVSVILKGGIMSDNSPLETAGSVAGTGFQIIVDKDITVDTGFEIKDYYYWGTYVESGEHIITFKNGDLSIDLDFTSYEDFHFISYEDDNHYETIDLLTGENKIKKWIIETETVTIIVSLGETYNMTFTTDIIAVAFIGGFISDEGDNVYYVRTEAEDYESGIVKGLYRVITKNMQDLKIHYFDVHDGHLLTISNNENRIIFYNNDIYIVDFNGYVIEFNGLYMHQELDDNLNFINNYYYFGKDNKAYKDGVFYIETTDSVYTSGYYRFDSNGHLLGKITHGLIQTNSGDYYYIDSTNNSVVDTTTIDSSESYVVTNKTVYVTDFDNSVAEQNRIVGLYYFGADGKLVSYKEVS